MDIVEAVRRLIQRSALLRSSVVPRIVFGVYLAALAVFSFLRPYYNWDLVGYVGAAFRLEGMDTLKVHDETYAVLRSQVPVEAYTELCSPSDPYKSLMAGDPAQFARRLRLFSIRPLYTSILALLHELGAPIVRATVLISIFSVIGTAIIVLLWLRQRFAVWPATVSAILLLSSARIPDLARFSTPDAAAAFIFLAGLYMLIHGGGQRAGYFVLWLSLFVRTDYVVPLLVLLAFQRYGDSLGPSLSPRRFALLTTSALATVILIHLVNGHFIWDEMPYGRGVLTTIRQLFLNDLFIVLPCFLGLNIITLVTCRNERGTASTFVRLSQVALVSLTARIILFPHLAERFYAVEYLLTGISFVVTRFKAGLQTTPAAACSP